MSATFELTVMTPEREFYSGQAEALTITGLDGSLTVLAHHAPMISCLEIGVIRIKTDGVWKEAFNSEGFMEVLGNTVVVFIQSCEWPEDIDMRRAQEARQRAEEKLRQKQNIREFSATKIALAKAMARITLVNRSYINLDR
ncbi:MAG: ATP synthase F1 subunit epsilon [Clostridiales bacterium]|jgi:F-type H+-transporting ATPase subunit epsilon|nr:ATP synthase F1 subunit epsilon [Clostridiales bacterium]